MSAKEKIKKNKIYVFLKEKYFQFRSYRAFIKLYFKDAIRFYRYSSALRRPRNPANLRALIAIDHHRIEKGMAMPNPRFPFGIEVVARLLGLIEKYQNQTDNDHDWICHDALSSLDSYFERHKSCEDVSDLQKKYANLCETVGFQKIENKKKAVGVILKHELKNAINFDFESFLSSRHSIRDFAPGKVGSDQIKYAVQLAAKAPSVCNRQPWKVFEVGDSEKIAELCRIQGGSRGFSEMVSSLLVTTVDLREFHSIGERSEAWVDGGIFLGNLLLALHSMGFGACPLNWCVSEIVDKTARDILPEIEKSRVIIALTAVGNLKEEIRFARSERVPIEEVFESVK